MSACHDSRCIPLVFAICATLSLPLLRRRLFPTPLENIPGPPGESWISGSLNQLVNPRSWKFNQDISEQYGPVIRTKGAFGRDALYVFDPKALHHVFIKDQDVYEETARFIEGNKLAYGHGILSTLGDAHRRHRKMLNPVFSASHMRNILPIFYGVARKVQKVLTDKVQNGAVEVDIARWMTRMALELIGQSGLGYSFDELSENAEPHPFALAAKQLIPLQGHTDELITTVVMPKLTRIGTPAIRKFVVDLVPFGIVKVLREIVDTFHKTSIEIFNSKKQAIEAGDEALAAEIGQGKDIISILMRANMQASEADKLSDEEVLGNISMLAFAATDTTSGALSRVIHLLALNKDVQSKLREEIRTARAKNGGEDVGYDELVSLPYLDAICRETLRLYPPVPLANRTVVKDVVMPFSKPIKDKNGDDIDHVLVPKGTEIYASVISSNRNRELWGPDAYEWKPERWLNPLPKSLIEARLSGIYSHLMTFLGGGRACIGFKFSQLEMKVALSLLLENIEFSLGSKEIVWQMNGMATPNVNYESANPTMPMMISLAKQSTL